MRSMKPPKTAALVAAAATTVLAFAGPAAASDGKHVVEGDTGSTKAKVSLELDAPVPHLPVTVHFSTHDGTATAGRDYLSRSGTVTFGAFDTEREISVTVLGDTLYEGDETFFVDTGHGHDSEDEGHRITIVDDDPAPAVSISDATGGESSGSARFDVTLSAPSGRTTTVDYATADGTAAAPGDYTAKTGTVTFAPGETT